MDNLDFAFELDIFPLPMKIKNWTFHRGKWKYELLMDNLHFGFELDILSHPHEKEKVISSQRKMEK